MDSIITRKGWKRWARPKYVTGLVVFLVAVAASVLLLNGFRRHTLRTDLSRLQVATVSRGKFDEFIAVTGTVQPLKTVILVALAGGIVEEKMLEDGAMVQKGTPILKLSNQDLALDYMNRETALLDQLNNLRNTSINLEQSHLNMRQQLLDLENQYRLAERTYKVNQRLMGDSLISADEFFRSKENFENLKSKKDLLAETVSKNEKFKNYQTGQLEFSSNLIQRNLENLRSNLENLLICSPADGQLTGMNIETGQNITKGEKVAEIDLLQGYRVNALVHELYISRISPGLKAKVSFGGKDFELVVDKIYPQVNKGQFRVDLKFSHDVPQGIKYGQTLQVRLSLGETTTTLLLKKGGFFQQTGGNWVFVLHNGKAGKRKTSFGRQNPDFFEIKDGLTEGEQVIISSYEVFGDAEELIIE